MLLDLVKLSSITIPLLTIQSDFHISIGNMQWIISAYALTFGGFLLMGGRGGDALRHHRILIFQMAFFVLFSLVCALAPLFMNLATARAFQGIGTAFTIPPAQAHIVLHLSDPVQKAKALGVWGPAGSLDFTNGLVLGGVLTAFLG